MIFQTLLIAALCIFALYAYFQRRKAPAVSVAVLLLAIAGLVLAVEPELANRLSRAVGIGRGADLVIYCFIVIALVAIFNLHLRFRSNEESLTRIVRALALASPQRPDAAGDRAPTAVRNDT